MKLLPFQRRNFAAAALRDGVILSLEQGLGKSIAAFIIPFLWRSPRVLLVAPVDHHLGAAVWGYSLREQLDDLAQGLLFDSAAAHWRAFDYGPCIMQCEEWNLKGDHRRFPNRRSSRPANLRQSVREKTGPICSRL